MNFSNKNTHNQSIFIELAYVCAYLVRRNVSKRVLVSLCAGFTLGFVFNSQIWNTNPLPKNESNDTKRLCDDTKVVWNSTWDNLETSSSGYVRHIYLVRHGQYFHHAQVQSEMKLTPLGKEQVSMTGQRFKEMNIDFDRLIHSGVVRARESAEIIHEKLGNHLEVIEDSNLAEALPVAPIPYEGVSQAEVDAMGHRARVDKAFETYFHRARIDQQKDTHDIIVFHGNIMRYFICKVMQFPVEAWLRITIEHASITHIIISHNGNVGFYRVGDSGFLPVNKLSA